MTVATLDRIGGFAGSHVLVVGEAMLDAYLWGTTGRLAQEAPVPVVAVGERSNRLGGAANVAANVAALGARASLVSVVGDDLEGEVILKALRERGMDVAGVLVEAGRRTLSKSRVLADGQMVVRFDEGSVDPVDTAREREMLGVLDRLWPEVDAVIISDYGYGVLVPAVIDALADRQGRNPRLLIVDAKDLRAYRNAAPTVIKPNYAQAVGMLDGGPAGFDSRAAFIAGNGEALLVAAGARIAAVTLDTEGAIWVERGRSPYRTYTRPSANATTAGAGDTFVAALTLSLAAGSDTPTAAEVASAAASIVVDKRETAECSVAELRARLFGGEKVGTVLDDLRPRLEYHHGQGRRIVLTNGCFDILHRGHVTYLSRAKALGDLLVVAVNSDDGVRRLKGPGRPINALEDRMQVLAALSCVDLVVPFDEPTPVEVIRVLRPDVFVKGGDYTREMLPEAPVVEALGGAVHILPYVEDRSTTGIIERISERLGTRADGRTGTRG
ncbi:D-glycero-beta-D-manno-heptose-7-phosphate kinase [soil metagenome]